MSGKRRHEEREAQLRALAERERRVAEARGVAVDRAALAPNNSYVLPPAFMERGYYVDEPFVCRLCSIPQTWTATQQKWWYEVAKGYLFSTASLCRPCRRQERARKEQAQRTGGDPDPYKNPGLLLAKVRSDLEPDLLSAGYLLVGRNNRRFEERRQFLDYGRPSDLLTISWDQHVAMLAAELLIDGGADIQVIATAEFDGARSTAEFEVRLAPFVAAIRSFLAGQPRAESRTET